MYARRYNAAGAAQGENFRVNSFTTGLQSEPSVAIDADGDFVIAWNSLGQDGSGYGIYAQSYSALGVPLGTEFRANTYTANGQSRPSLAIDGSGDVVIAWHSYLQDGSGWGVYAQRYTNVAAPSVANTQVNNAAPQRSRVTSLAVTFNAPVDFAGSVISAFNLSRNGGTPVSFTAAASIVSGVTVVTLNNFTGPETESGSLRDGNYTLTALASQISANGQPIAADYQYSLFRFYGDMNGDRRVDISDFGFFSLAFLQPLNYNAALDFNNDGRIDIADFGQFSARFFTTLP